MSDWSRIAAALTARFAAAGFDLVQPFRIGWFNDAAAPDERLPDFGGADRLGIVIGSSRALWSRFLETWRDDAELNAAADPIDRYAVRSISAALAEVPRRWRVRWSHDAPPRRPPMQRLAHRAGLAHLAACALNVHPAFGPWIALRAVVVIDVPGPDGAPPDPANPCPDCANACLPAFARATAALRDDPGAAFGLGDTWRLWLAVRDACPVGREHRYSDAQIAYHYRNDRGVLSSSART